MKEWASPCPCPGCLKLSGSWRPQRLVWWKVKLRKLIVAILASLCYDT